jgi:hypothetical protein
MDRYAKDHFEWKTRQGQWREAAGTAMIFDFNFSAYSITNKLPPTSPSPNSSLA